MKNKQKIPVGVYTSVLSCALLVLCTAILTALWYYLKFLPLLLMALVILLPALINLLLLVPDGRTYKKPERKPKPEKQKKNFLQIVKEIPVKIRNAFLSVSAFVSRNRIAIMLTLMGISLVLVNLFFWLRVGKGSEHSLGFVVPVVIAAAFVLVIVLDKWLKYASVDYKNTREEVIAKNLRSTLAIFKIMLVLALAVVTFCVLGFFDLQKWLIIALSVIFVYQCAFIVLSLVVRVIKKELYTNPDILVPLPWSTKGDNLDIISYLEKNTGITMRSLWSILLIKKIIPFAVLGCAFVLWLSTGIVQIEPYQKGALYRLGKLDEDYLNPGIHLTLPWPFDKVEVYNTEVVNEITVGYLATDATDNLWTEAHGNNEYKLLLGGGNELVSINLRVEYKIGDLGKFLKCSSSPAKLVESTAYETVTNKTINTDLDSLLATDRSAFSKSFEKELVSRLAKYNTGVEIVGVVIESIHPPVEVAQIYQKIISAEIEAERILYEAKGKAGVTIAEANTQYDTDINKAMAESHKLKADAQSSIAEFLASVECDESYGDGYRYYKYIQALTKAYSGSKLVIVGDGIDSSNIYFGKIS